tara:strand:- start:125 stop:301 length:177 start_codon:yes stop_codon:yes gene_type:complete
MEKSTPSSVSTGKGYATPTVTDDFGEILRLPSQSALEVKSFEYHQADVSGQRVVKEVG